MTSRKVKWYRSMCDKIDHENKLKELAGKVADGAKLDVKLPKDKGGYHKPRKVTLFKEFVEEAKFERQKRNERDRKHNKGRKENSNEN